MIEIIPAIDLIDGKCVRLSQGDFAQKKIYNENPLEVAVELEQIGIKRLHLVDLDGAKNGKIINLKVLEAIANGTNLTIDFGGGIKSDEDIEAVFNAGASIASIGSIAVKDSERFFSWIKRFGSDRILLGADVRNKKLSINGWLTDTELEILPFLKDYCSNGVTQVFCTDISKDGLLQGTSTELYKEILTEIPELKLIASGGVSNIDDVYELDRLGCAGVIIGKAIYEGKIKLEEIKGLIH